MAVVRAHGGMMQGDVFSLAYRRVSCKKDSNACDIRRVAEVT
jgi:hypothetical protein